MDVLRIHHVIGIGWYTDMQLNMVIWTCSSGMVLRIHHVLGMRVLCVYVARNGNLDVIEWLCTQILPASWLRHLPQNRT